MRAVAICSFILILCGCQGPQKGKSSLPAGEMPEQFNIAWYNVENLFDTSDDPKKRDDDFTPEGRLEWGDGRYEEKIKNLGRVIQAMEDESGLPRIIGLAEVENAEVCQDLAEFIAPGKYKVLSHNSLDARGIDVALLYDASLFTLVVDEARRVRFRESGYTSRDILYAQLMTKEGEFLHLFLNHWPSRRGGWQETEHRRVSAAETLKDFMGGLDKKVDIILAMGDFNDYPDNRSMREALGAVASDNKAVRGELVNLTAELDELGKGSYNYKGDWGMLDQVVVSDAMLDGQGLEIAEEGVEIFQKDFMMYYDRKYKESYPSRSFGGQRYYGGYSDHLPLLIHLNKTN